jgi:ubiquinone/menaquinone biosynthesis C-methylase UbiE
MPDQTYEDNEYWDNLRKSSDYYRQENVVVEGNEGENEFDAKILDAITGKIVLDVGCGIGLFTIGMAKQASEMFGVDFSEEAILRSLANLARSEAKNCVFINANSNELPFQEETFDIVVSRRGPVTDNILSLSEAYRVLQNGGRLMEITIGEQDKANIVRIFGRGQMLDIRERVALSKEKILKSVGFQVLEVKDYLATEIFQTIADLVIRLNSAPIIPNFDAKRDSEYLRLVEEMCSTERGVETEVHRVTLVATKSQASANT